MAPSEKMNFNGKAVSDNIANEGAWIVGTPGIYSFLVPQEENKGISILICPGAGFQDGLFTGAENSRQY